MGLQHLTTSDWPLGSKFDATTGPTVNDDIDLGYNVGCLWVDVTNDEAYICVDNTDGAAVWIAIFDANLVKAQIRQDSANWVGNGQNIRVGASWVNFTEEDFADVDLIHDTTVYESGTATGTQSGTTLQDTSKAWTIDEWTGYTVKLTGGTGADEVVKILSNTADTLTVDTTWITTPVTASTTYEINLKGRLTVPEDGLYLVAPRLTYNNSPGRILGTYIYKNNVFFNSSFFSLAVAIETTVPYNPETMLLSAGDYIEIKGYNGGAGAHALLAFGSRVRCSITKIGE